ncbi:hypothetical protein OK351_16485 [Glutamicibacter sp. MNS18]|uniref:hypothetical protein n=1 Tax=Glutamicibacter sp. MNS18 TaxID=2989817 RepID=UPI002235DF89|nr:hypothetical protein [Glutamicibacter sp. MNS18]MCW4467083.1 hypothetical protein [Glutamicibacter sp. MNS18]
MTRELDPSDFAPQYGNDLYEPDDGRDSQAYEGSSDMPESMRNIDPLAQRSYLLDDDLEEESDLDNEFLEQRFNPDDLEQAEDNP